MKKLLIRLAVSLVIGGAFLWLASRKMSFEGAWATIRAARWTMLLPFAGSMLVQHLFRTWRWGQLLAPIHPVPFSRLLPVSSVGFLAIIALPLRMGEFVRPYLIAKPPRLKMSQAFGTMAVERVFDGLILSLGAFSAVMLARFRGVEVPSWVFSAGVVALGLFCAALAVLVMTLWKREQAVTLCRKLFSLFSAKLADKAAGVAEGIVEGFKVLPDVKRLSLFLVATLGYWGLNAVALWMVAAAFDLPLAFGSSFGLLALVGIGIMIPAGPGFAGNFEYFANGALSLYLPPGLLAKTGPGFILAAHATNAGWYLVTGLLALLSSHVSFHRLIVASTKGEQAGAPPDTPKK
ncbi:MAG: hypothetical protein CSA65_06665 [Proteobacteria bacterium]|nr:MAG: hypothetical protein CSB49_00355 [Pseudomonadota bacterium]PIE17963.1 MAG: hypothetical protein CSA65_06665 [Pseudomonadota bacterium]